MMLCVRRENCQKKLFLSPRATDGREKDEKWGGSEGDWADAGKMFLLMLAARELEESINMSFNMIELFICVYVEFQFPL